MNKGREPVKMRAVFNQVAQFTFELTRKNSRLMISFIWFLDTYSRFEPAMVMKAFYKAGIEENHQ